MKKVSLSKYSFFLILVIVFFSLFFRLPFADKALWHDEIYNTNTYLDVHPNSQSEQKNIVWSEDWKRQLQVHPPFVYSFYFLWVGLFGDSEVSMHIPTIILSIISLIFIYLLVELVFDLETAFFSTIAVSICSTHIMYSIESVHAIFELTIFIISLYFFSRFILEKKRKSFFILSLLNLIGISIFYHYIFYFILQIVIFYFNRKKLSIKISYFIICSLFLFIFSLFFIKNYLNGNYNISFWPINSPINTLTNLIFLPYYSFSAGISIYNIQEYLFFSSIFIFFIISGFNIFFEKIKNKSEKTYLKRALFIIFFSPFFLYFFTGLLNIRFGWRRNFIYLLPLYITFSFYGIQKIKYPYPKYVSFFILLFLSLFSLMDISSSWTNNNLKREEIKKLYLTDSDCIILYRSPLFSLPVAHYLTKADIFYKRFTFNHEEGYFYTYLNYTNTNKTQILIVNFLREKETDKIIYHVGEKNYTSGKMLRYKTDKAPLLNLYWLYAAQYTYFEHTICIEN